MLTGRLLDLSNPECLAWVEKHVFEVMDRAGVNIYRQDFNIPPAEIWAENDGPNRKGITEKQILRGISTVFKRYTGALSGDSDGFLCLRRRKKRAGDYAVDAAAALFGSSGYCAGGSQWAYLYAADHVSLVSVCEELYFSSSRWKALMPCVLL